MVGYFTILPVSFREEENLTHPKVGGAMLFWLPFAGVLCAGGGVILYTLFESLHVVAGILGAIAYPMLYGFLHTEAITDVADALYAKHSGKDAYTIIKASTIGAMGMLWTLALFLLKIALIAFVLLHGVESLFLGVAISSRIGLEMLFLTQRFRSRGIEALQQGFTPSYFLYSMGLFSMVGWLIAGGMFFILLLMALGGSYLIASWLKRALGFINGDVLGTTLEVNEILLLLGGLLLWL